MKFDDSLKLAIELEKQGFNSYYNILREIRLFSDGYMEGKKSGFIPFELPNKDGKLMSIPIKVNAINYSGYGSYNQYTWEIN